VAYTNPLPHHVPNSCPENVQSVALLSQSDNIGTGTLNTFRLRVPAGFRQDLVDRFDKVYQKCVHFHATIEAHYI
jgi:hypothetical protein